MTENKFGVDIRSEPDARVSIDRATFGYLFAIAVPFLESRMTELMAESRDRVLAAVIKIELERVWAEAYPAVKDSGGA